MMRVPNIAVALLFVIGTAASIRNYRRENAYVDQQIAIHLTERILRNKRYDACHTMLLNIGLRTLDGRRSIPGEDIETQYFACFEPR